MGREGIGLRILNSNTNFKHLLISGIQRAHADLSTDEVPPSLYEPRATAARVRGGEAAGTCKISAELLKGGELHVVLSVVMELWNHSS